MKNGLYKVMATLIAAIPVVAAFAVTVSANNIASPNFGQPVPPKNLKEYRKF